MRGREEQEDRSKEETKETWFLVWKGMQSGRQKGRRGGPDLTHHCSMLAFGSIEMPPMRITFSSQKYISNM